MCINCRKVDIGSLHIFARADSSKMSPPPEVFAVSLHILKCFIAFPPPPTTAHPLGTYTCLLYPCLHRKTLVLGIEAIKKGRAPPLGKVPPPAPFPGQGWLFLPFVLRGRPPPPTTIGGNPPHGPTLGTAAHQLTLRFFRRPKNSNQFLHISLKIFQLFPLRIGHFYQICLL